MPYEAGMYRHRYILIPIGYVWVVNISVEMFYLTDPISAEQELVSRLIMTDFVDVNDATTGFFVFECSYVWGLWSMILGDRFSIGTAIQQFQCSVWL